MEKKWALITGASSGIGFAYAEELASRGYQLVIVSNEEQAIRDKDTCKAFPGPYDLSYMIME